MKRLLLAVIAGFVSVGSACAQTGQVIAWPPPPPLPPGTNPATTPAPRLEWFQEFKQHLDDARKAGPIDILFDGDSITAGWMGAGRDTWNKYLVPRHAFDMGIGGDRTENILWRLDQGQVDGIHPKLVVILIGTNDNNLTPAQIADGVKAVVAEYQQKLPGVPILLQGIFPRGEKPDEPLRVKMAEANKLIAPLGDGQKVIYLDFGRKFLQPDGTISREIMADFLHPTAPGYQIWIDAIQPVLDRFAPQK